MQCLPQRRGGAFLAITSLPNAWAGPQTHGWVKAKRDGNDWMGSSTATIELGDSTKVSFGFDTFGADTLVIEETAFIWVPLKVGKYIITNNRSTEHSIYWVGYFDEIDAAYQVNTSKQNYLWIDSYDPAIKLITGRFQAFYRKKDKFSIQLSIYGGLHRWRVFGDFVLIGLV